MGANLQKGVVFQRVERKTKKNIIALDNRVYVSNDTFKELRFLKSTNSCVGGLRHRFVNKPVMSKTKFLISH
jgi:hypothetical protein